MKTPHTTRDTIHRSAGIAALAAIAGLAATAVGQTIHPEIEPNNNKEDANANGIFLLAAGDGVTGVSVTPEDPDYFLLRTTAADPGIYRHRLLISTTGPEGHIARIAGLSQSGGTILPGTDVIAQGSLISTDPPRMIQWYGFGRQEQLYYRVHGTEATTGPYTAILETEPVTITDLGTFQAGTIEITTVNQLHNVNTSLWVYDSDLEPIPDFGNSNEPFPGTAVGSRLTREFAPGVYHLALSANNLALDLPRPPDDRNQNAIATDFPDILLSSNAFAADVSFQISDEHGPVKFPASRSSFEVLWYRFTVGSVTPGACCLPAGDCVVATAASCETQDGIFRGVGTECGPGANCPQPAVGACCLLDNSCIEVWQGECHAQSGTYAGDGEPCAGITCPSTLFTIFPATFNQASNVGSFFNLTPTTGLTIPRIDYFAWASAGITTSVEIWVFPGSYVGRDTDPTGWVLHDSVQGPSGPSFEPTALHLNNPLSIETGETVGVYLLARFGGIRYSGSGGSFQNDDLTLFSDLVRTAPWAGVAFERAFSGTIYYTLGTLPEPCFANCDGSTTIPVLTVDDFTCFINRFAEATGLPHEEQIGHYANCDNSTTPPVLTVDDFTCFINAFAQGCP